MSCREGGKDQRPCGVRAGQQPPPARSCRAFCPYALPPMAQRYGSARPTSPLSVCQRCRVGQCARLGFAPRRRSRPRAPRLRRRRVENHTARGLHRLDTSPARTAPAPRREQRPLSHPALRSPRSISPPSCSALASATTPRGLARSLRLPPRPPRNLRREGALLGHRYRAANWLCFAEHPRPLAKLDRHTRRSPTPNSSTPAAV